MNIVPRVAEVTLFDRSQAFLAARIFRPTEQLVMLTLVLATDVSGAVIMTSREVARRTGLVRRSVIRAMQQLLFRQLVLVRDEVLPYRYAWNVAMLESYARSVQERERSAGVTGTQKPTPQEFRAAWLAAERSERARKQGHLRFGVSVEPSPDAYAWLHTWSGDMCTDTGRSLDAVARMAWRRWLLVEGRVDRRGHWVSYESHDFTWLVTELRKSVKLSNVIREALRRVNSAKPLATLIAEGPKGAVDVLNAIGGKR